MGPHPPDHFLNSSQLTLVNGDGGDPRRGSPTNTCYTSYMANYISPMRHANNDRPTSGQLGAIGTGAQCLWAGTRGQGLGSQPPGCEVSQRQPYRVGAVSDCPRPPRGRDFRQLVSVSAPETPSKKPSARQSEGATLRPGGMAAELASNSFVPSGGVVRFSLVGARHAPRRSAAGIGFRALRPARCLQDTDASHPSPRGLACPGGGGVEAITPPLPGQLRGGHGRISPGQSAHIVQGHASRAALLHVDQANLTKAFVQCTTGV